jgi:hypothetical protein
MKLAVVQRRRDRQQNGASRSPVRMERALGSHLLWVIEVIMITSDCKGDFNKSNHPIKTPLLLVMSINRDNIKYFLKE